MTIVIRTVVSAAVAVALSVAAAPPVATRQAAAPLADRIEALRASGDLPAVAVATFRSAEVLERAAAGVRARGASSPVNTGDVWHIGSITKSFTATLVGRIVEKGELSWTTPLRELVGAERAGKYGSVTVEHLLSHRAGLPANAPPQVTMQLANSAAGVTAQRQQLLTLALSTDPASAPGEAFLYSNVGYIIMGAILEARSGRAWEDLIRVEILEPLKLASAGFGPPGTAGTLSQPRGHRGTPPTPVEPGPGADNPAFLGPAGRLHMTVDDLVRWGQAHLRGERGDDGLLRSETMRRLHTPPAGDYAYGWVVRRNGPQRVIWHNGSNTMWYAVVAFDPDADAGVAIVTNGPIGARAVIDPAVAVLMPGRAGGPG